MTKIQNQSRWGKRAWIRALVTGLSLIIILFCARLVSLSALALAGASTRRQW
jgi:hypothetical protein